MNEIRVSFVVHATLETQVEKSTRIGKPLSKKKKKIDISIPIGEGRSIFYCCFSLIRPKRVNSCIMIVTAAMFAEDSERVSPFYR